MPEPDIQELEFACCYCDVPMDRPEMFQVVLVWPTAYGQEQTWWCHRNCFVESLSPRSRIMRDD